MNSLSWSDKVPTSYGNHECVISFIKIVTACLFDWFNVQ